MKKVPIINDVTKEKRIKAFFTYKAIVLNCIIFVYFFIVIFIYYKNSINKFNKKAERLSKDKRIYNDINFNRSNINLNDEFFQIKRVIEQIKNNNITYVNTIAGGKAKIGNALIMLNNLINICEKIECKNIITPEGLECLIKKPIFYKLYNITILPNSYKDKIKIDINLNHSDLFYFKYRKQPHYMRLSILKDEIFDNIPKYNANPNDLFIHIRSGDIFIDHFSKYYSQPPLCFYKKIINNFKFDNIYILSNGHENPVLDSLLKAYPNINFIKGSIESDISKILYAYNLVSSESTFITNLIRFNKNLRKLFVYELFRQINHIKNNLTIYKMKPSNLYIQIMKLKWKKMKEQLDLMINENCYNNNLTPFYH